MKLIGIIKIIEDIFTKACIYFTGMTLIITAAASFFNQTIVPGTYLMFALAALGAGISVQIFRITRIPAVSRHIALFILLYLDFLLIAVPISNYTSTTSTNLYLSVIFIIAYAAVSGIIIGIKSAVNAVKNNKLQYDDQFKNINR